MKTIQIFEDSRRAPILLSDALMQYERVHLILPNSINTQNLDCVPCISKWATYNLTNMSKNEYDEISGRVLMIEQNMHNTKLKAVDEPGWRHGITQVGIRLLTKCINGAEAVSMPVYHISEKINYFKFDGFVIVGNSIICDINAGGVILIYDKNDVRVGFKKYVNNKIAEVYALINCGIYADAANILSSLATLTVEEFAKNQDGDSNDLHSEE